MKELLMLTPLIILIGGLYYGVYFVPRYLVGTHEKLKHNIVLLKGKNIIRMAGNEGLFSEKLPSIFELIKLDYEEVISIEYDKVYFNLNIDCFVEQSVEVLMRYRAIDQDEAADYYCFLYSNFPDKFGKKLTRRYLGEIELQIDKEIYSDISETETQCE